MAHRLIGLIEGCGDPDCLCQTPRIYEEYEDRWGEMQRSLFWEGTFLSGASRSETEDAEEELAAASARHGLERQWGESEVIYERAL